MSQEQYDYEVTRELYEQQRQIEVLEIRPPIPCRDFDWQATRAGYEPGEPIGWGSTRHAAVQDLIREERK